MLTAFEKEQNQGADLLYRQISMDEFYDRYEKLTCSHADTYESFTNMIFAADEQP